MHRLVKKLKDPLYRNSFFIMLSSVTNAGFGFFFRMVSAKLYLGVECSTTKSAKEV